MSEIDPAVVAKSLSEAQRKAVLSDDTHYADQWKGHISCWGNSRTAATLFNAGLIATNETLAVLTPLGLAVRAILESDHD